MGLDVTIYEDVKTHECETKRPLAGVKTKYLKKKMSEDLYIFTPDDNVLEEALNAWSPYSESMFECDCKHLESRVVYIYPGYISCLDTEKYPYFGPYEFQHAKNFYFGSYSKFARLSKFVPILRDYTSDCDGCYGDEGFLEALRNQLECVKDEDPKLKEYFTLLEGKDLANCVVKHS